MEFFVWRLSALFVAYTVAVYPLSMILMGVFRKRRPAAHFTHDDLPAVAVIIAACNEAAHIGDGLRTLLESDYPSTRRRVLVVIDEGCTDATASIVESFAAEGVRLVRSPYIGKNACLDFVIGRLTEEIIVFKDASTVFAPKALRNLIDRFADPQVGCVGGVVQFHANADVGSRERGYWIIEEWMRSGTETLGYMPSAAGGIHALRRCIYEPVGNHLTRDMVDPVQAIAAGYYAIRADDALGSEVPWGAASSVFWNRIRVTMRAWASIRYNVRRLIASRKWLILGQLVSHKVCRLMLWLPLLLMSITSVILGHDSHFFATLAAAQLAVFGGIALLLATPHLWPRIPGTTMVIFLSVNLAAMACGSTLCLLGRRAVTWRSTEGCEVIETAS